LLKPSRILLGLLLTGTGAALIFSGRPWRGYAMPVVAEIAVLPDDARFAQVRRYTEIGSGFFPYVGGPRPDRDQARPPLKLGYAYDEHGILGLPYGVGYEYGLVAYFEQAEGIQVAVIGEGQRPLLDSLIGRPLTQNYRFRWYLRVWGWLFPPAFFGWILLWRREDKLEEQRLMEAAWND
jgi:hypothetical protein